MPSHQERVRRVELPKDYQFGDAGRTKDIVVPREAFIELIGLIECAYPFSHRVVDGLPPENRVLLVANTRFVMQRD